MREHRSDRARPSRRAVVAGTVLALALGAWWWVGNSPAPAPEGAGLPPPDLRAGEPLAAAIVPEPAASARALVPGPEGDTWQMAEPRPTYLDYAQAVALLPPAEGAALRTGVRLASGERYLHDGPAPAGNYLLEIACTGGGELTATVTLPDYGYTRVHMICDAQVAELELTYRPGYTAIELVPEGRNRVDVAFQISRS